MVPSLRVTERVIWALTAFVAGLTVAGYLVYSLGQASGIQRGEWRVLYADSLMLRAHQLEAMLDSVTQELTALHRPRVVSARMRDSVRVARWTSP